MSFHIFLIPKAFQQAQSVNCPACPGYSDNDSHAAPLSVLFRFQNRNLVFSLAATLSGGYNCHAVQTSFATVGNGLRQGYSEDHIMDRAGEKLKRARERLKLTFRDVEQASQKIAAGRENDEFIIALSRLADIENKGTLPTIYRLYSLCAIYRLDFDEVLRWYGVPKDQLASETLHIGLEHTHIVQFSANAAAAIPPSLDCEIDLNQTTFLSRLMRRWGKLPLAFLNGMDQGRHRYGFIGLEDWSMYPILQPGSLVLLDESKRKIASEGWTNEFDRPIYFLERREGYECGWCTLAADRLLVQPHPASQTKVRVYGYPGDVDVVGQVVGVAMLFEPRKRRHSRSAATPLMSPNP
jgi:transcriptional regulator with XRE-family HTH domain